MGQYARIKVEMLSQVDAFENKNYSSLMTCIVDTATPTYEVFIKAMNELYTNHEEAFYHSMEEAHDTPPS